MGGLSVARKESLSEAANPTNSLSLKPCRKTMQKKNQSRELNSGSPLVLRFVDKRNRSILETFLVHPGCQLVAVGGRIRQLYRI